MNTGDRVATAEGGYGIITEMVHAGGHGEHGEGWEHGAGAPPQRARVALDAGGEILADPDELRRVFTGGTCDP